MTSAKITRTIVETRRYERTAEIVLDMAPRQTRAEATTVVVIETIGGARSAFDPTGPRVTLNVTRTTKKGEPTYTGSRRYDLAIVDVAADRWSPRNDFTPETVERLRELRDAVLDEWASIDWDSVKP